MGERRLLAGLMLAAILFALLLLLVVGVAAATRVSVSPAHGSRHTRFAVSFTLPAATGVSTGLHRTDQVLVTGPTRSGCVSSAAASVPARAAGTRVRVTLAPGTGRGWCRGRYAGRITESQGVICDPLPHQACPQIVIAPQTIARFWLRVR